MGESRRPEPLDVEALRERHAEVRATLMRIPRDAEEKREKRTWAAAWLRQVIDDESEVLDELERLRERLDWKEAWYVESQGGVGGDQTEN